MHTHTRAFIRNFLIYEIIVTNKKKYTYGSYNLFKQRLLLIRHIYVLQWERKYLWQGVNIYSMGKIMY